MESFFIFLFAQTARLSWKTNWHKANKKLQALVSSISMETRGGEGSFFIETQQVLIRNLRELPPWPQASLRREVIRNTARCFDFTQTILGGTTTSSLGRRADPIRSRRVHGFTCARVDSVGCKIRDTNLQRTIVQLSEARAARVRDFTSREKQTCFCTKRRRNKAAKITSQKFTQRTCRDDWWEAVTHGGPRGSRPPLHRTPTNSKKWNQITSPGRNFGANPTFWQNV